MLNKSGIYKATYASPIQILADPNLQFSVGCIVPTAAGTAIGDGRKIAQAGLPIVVNLEKLEETCKVADKTNAVNAVLLHDVDVTNGQANGTALIFGFVDLSKVSSDMMLKIKTAFDVSGATKNVILLSTK